MNCQQQFYSPIMFYKDHKIDDPDKIPLRAGLKTSLLQGVKGVDVESSKWMFIFPIYKYVGEFPKGKEGEFLSDMVRQYFLDTSMFEYVYNSPFRTQDVDVIVNVKLNKFILKNNKGWVTFRNMVPLMSLGASIALPLLTNSSDSTGTASSSSTMYWVSLGIMMLPLVFEMALPAEKYYAEYDIDVELLLPNGEEIKTYRKVGSGNESVGLSDRPYSEYLFYKSIFKKVFLALLDETRAEIKKDKDLIINKYKEFLIR